jgi:hypothetical protein
MKQALTELHSVRWFQAWLEKDAATVERLAAEDYHYVSPNGSTLDRPAILGIIRSPSPRKSPAGRHFEGAAFPEAGSAREDTSPLRNVRPRAARSAIGPRRLNSVPVSNA